MPNDIELAPDGWSRQQVLQLVLLISVVPLQYFLSSTENDRLYELKKLFNGLEKLKVYFEATYWIEICNNLWNFWSGSEPESVPVSELPETITTGNLHGRFGTSMDPRVPRPPFVKFRIGQVIKHKVWGYRGVIIGWDEIANAPISWLNEMHPNDKPEWRFMPNYAVLVDTRDRFNPQMSYVVEDNIEIVPTKIMHPLVDRYFETFDGNEYTPRPWLRKVYPYG